MKYMYNIFSFIDPADVEFDLPSSLPNLGVYKVGLHLTQILIGIIVLATTAPIISIEKHYQGSSQSMPSFTLAIAIISLFLAAALAVFPWSKITGKKGGLLKTFFLRPRTTVIFTTFMTIMWFIAMICMSVHSKSQTTCSLNADLEEKYDSYASSWNNQCHCSRASAVFSWFAFFAWLATAISSVILLWHEKKLRQAEHEARMMKKNEAHEDDNQTTISNNPYDEDARTIVDMKYSEKNGTPIPSYENLQSQKDPESPLPTALMSPAPSSHVMTPMTGNNRMASPYATVATPPQSVSPYSVGHYVASPYASPHYSVSNPPSYPSPYSNYVVSPPPMNTAVPYQSSYNAHSSYIPATSSPYAYHQTTPQFTGATPTYPHTSPNTMMQQQQVTTSSTPVTYHSSATTNHAI
ncbi:MAG: hypothetical protein EXX96DRAFT_616812 [Benjaminiella poitrasii]|nr:MAG: hypothetical protein EXX96DRAFT_616812 [Benjaminiella poitrasii]